MGLGENEESAAKSNITTATNVLQLPNLITLTPSISTSGCLLGVTMQSWCVARKRFVFFFQEGACVAFFGGTMAPTKNHKDEGKQDKSLKNFSVFLSLVLVV